MSQQSSMALTTESFRLYKDKFAKYGVTFGGVMVLVALLLIFFYLLYVVEPIFHSVEIEERTTIELNKNNDIGNTLAVGLEEQTEIGYRFTSTGIVEFFTLKKPTSGTTIKSVSVTEQANISAFAQTAPHIGQYAYAYDDGSVTVVRPRFLVTFPDNKRKISPDIAYPFGQEPLQIDEEGRALKQFAFSVDEETAGFIAITEDNAVIFSHWLAEENMMTEEIEWTPTFSTIEIPSTKPSQVLLTPDLSRAIVRAENNIFIVDTRDPEDVEVIQTFSANAQNANVVDAMLLAGANSLMITNSNGVISQWFEVNSENGRAFKEIRQFVGSSDKVNKLYPEYYRKTFFATGDDGSLGVYYTTSEATLLQQSIFNGPIDALAVAPRSNAVLIVSDNTLKVFEIENEHPEVTWSALWSEVWYEGYPEPDYIWQSTSASDDFESKFSLVPISFGTIKAAMYAMLFAVPIGLSAAIYTAYFMSPSMRKTVKPTIEIMEALPTVILGFLAGLWLAPLMEEYLPAVVLILILLPVAIILTAFAWHNLSSKAKQIVPEGWEPMILVPIVIIVSYFCFAVSPAVEELMFGGDIRAFITNDLGIDFDQRNSLVVGIAMGFAVIPTIFSIAEDAVFSVPKHLSNGSLALGATQWQTLTRVVLLTASPGIFSAIMMGLGRAVGETMIVLMATGNTPIMDWSIFQGMRTLSANIAVEMPESEVGSSHYRILFLAAFVLFIFTFIFNTVAEFVRQRLREKYSSL
ncbi:ABC transporter permease subunit [Flocculibacter collagenilyticus]|uniref:ABC transporter permease subunit n=1 Tax=Flocculibacter collagenilyticus TaxID=2744479 RepID=UPI001F420AF6|nr:ABC transporter permease subunit [Flocculibacter collagenilyticus]